MSELKDWRLSRDMSQSDLAKASGVNIRMIQYYEQGVKDINKAQVMTVKKLADALHTTIEDLMEP